MKTVKKILYVTIITLLLLILVACSSTSNSEDSRLIDNKNTVKVPVLTDDEAERLEIEAANRFMSITSGYFGPRLTETSDELFYYLPEELDSMEKLVTYLEEVVTTENAKKIIAPEYYKIINNKLAFKPRDYFSAREWDKATFKIICDEEDKKTYEYTVPSPGGIRENITIEFKYERNGWRINTPPYEFL